MLCVYHDPCNDGFCAAWVVSKFYKTDIEYVPAAYHDVDLLDNVLGMSDKHSIIYVVDFSFNTEGMEKLCDSFDHVILIDHHEKAVKELENFTRVNLTKILEIGKSGAKLTNEFLEKQFRVTSHTPWQVDYTEDRDLWLHKLVSTEEVNTYLTIVPRTFEAWDKVSLVEAISGGKSMIMYKKMLIDQHVQKVQYGKLYLEGRDPIPCGTVNCTVKVIASDIGNDIVKLKPGYIGIINNTEGGCSVRSDGVFNVNELCQLFGGGGHKAAAGCPDTILEFFKADDKE